jgi:salicylate hydroxylase
MTRSVDNLGAGRSVSIIGAGLGGLTAALALMRQGWAVRVFEQAPVLTEVGAGITLSPGAGRGLASLGLEPDLLAASLPIPDIAFLHYRTGALLAGVMGRDAPVDRGFATPRHIHRADLHAILLSAVRRLDPLAVASGKRLVHVDQIGGRVVARFSDSSAAESDVLVGADGARSVVRRQLIDDRPPDFAGQIAFRCLIPRDQAEPYMAGASAAVSIGAGRIFNRYLIRGGALVNVIGIARSERWRDESWNTPATTDEFLAEYAGFHADVLGLIARAPSETLIKWGLFVRPPIETWSMGRVVLLGDAAHPILPFLGLGAALAIEDGVVLARALAMTDDAKVAFAAFERARRDRVETVRTQTIRQGEIIQAGDPDRASLSRSPSQNVDIFAYDPCEAAIHV